MHRGRSRLGRTGLFGQLRGRRDRHLPGVRLGAAGRRARRRAVGARRGDRVADPLRRRGHRDDRRRRHGAAWHLDLAARRARGGDAARARRRGELGRRGRAAGDRPARGRRAGGGHRGVRRRRRRGRGAGRVHAVDARRGRRRRRCVDERSGQRRGAALRRMRRRGAAGGRDVRGRGEPIVLLHVRPRPGSDPVLLRWAARLRARRRGLARRARGGHRGRRRRPPGRAAGQRRAAALHRRRVHLQRLRHQPLDVAVRAAAARWLRGPARRLRRRRRALAELAAVVVRQRRDRASRRWHGSCHGPAVRRQPAQLARRAGGAARRARVPGRATRCCASDDDARRSRPALRRRGVDPRWARAVRGLRQRRAHRRGRGAVPGPGVRHVDRRAWARRLHRQRRRGW